MSCDFCGRAECDCPHPNLSKPALDCEGCDKPIANEDNYAVMLNDQSFHFCSLKCMREFAKVILA